MKHDCDIVRDLMPLVVDGTASEKSREMVGEHVAECEPCREMFDEMRQEVPAQPQRQAGKLVRKLRWRRRLRGAALVLLGVALSALLAVAGIRGWNYCFNDYCVLTAEENYSIDVAQGYYGVEVVLTIKDGHAQASNAYFDAEAGDLYLWSTTTRVPVPAASDKEIGQHAQLYYAIDIGYAHLTSSYDWDEKKYIYDVMPINHIIKGAPDFPGYEPHTQQVIYELAEPSAETLTVKWRERMKTEGLFDEWKSFYENLGRNFELVWETE